MATTEILLDGMIAARVLSDRDRSGEALDQEATMKSQLRCILFALIAFPACGGEHAAPSASKPVTTAPAAPPAVIAAPDPVAPPPALAPVEVAAVAAVAPPPVAPATYAEALAQGKAAEASGDHARARQLFEAAVKLDKKAAEPHLELARVFIATGERGLAVAAARKAVKLAPESSPAYNTLGRAELARFNYDAAVDAFVHAVELNPDNAWAWNNLGFTHLQRKHYREAVDALVEATARQGVEGYMWNNLGTAYEQIDLLDDARAAFEAGGKLGSKEALASRKRLQGVKTIVVKADPSKQGGAVQPAESEGYDRAEPMPPVPDAVIDGAESPEAQPADEIKPPAVPEAEPPKVDAPKIDAAKVDAAKVDAAKAEKPAPSSL
jgi:Flp pilus assembly protein TadD